LISWASPLAQYGAHKTAIQAAVMRVLESGIYVLGNELDTFERAFASSCGVSQGVGVGSGTDALILGLRALGVGPGDEVITVSHTALATVAAVIATGATPVLVDVDPVFYTMDAAAVKRAATSRTKAIIAVHLYGQSVDMDAIIAVAGPLGFPVIEDCAQAAGGKYGSRALGSLGVVGCFSFYPTKNLGAVGDGGMVVTNDTRLAGRVRRLRQYGWDESRRTQECGLNSRLDPLQAAILNAKLPHLSAENARRAAIAERYQKGLADLPITLPAVRGKASHVYHLYVIACADRDGLIAHLGKEGIGTAVHYAEPVHRHKGYGERAVLPKEGLPITEQLATRIVSLPIYPELPDIDVDRVIASIRGFFRS
jgi:dTDP-4-amino-4,6-dideoxygalactose transaminase